jgi:MFS transporter, NNP family, nitrate/nitrite transporter
MKVIQTTKASKIDLFSFKTPNMKAFHITWITFFLCFFGWFGVAPLMVIVRQELQLTQGQVGNIMIASVLITIFARLAIGWFCDRFGPRLTYTALLLVGSLPVMMIGFSNSYESFLLFRLGIGVIGASFVITQYHTSVMFAPNVVGTANAVTAGWGNLGGGVTHMVMPLIFAGFVGLGYLESEAWRFAMVIPGVALFLMAFVYYFFTQDTPDGNILDLRKQNAGYQAKKKDMDGSFLSACKNYRVWILFLVYGCSFGIEITLDNVLALYFKDEFNLSLGQAGFIAGSFGMMNFFARPLGGIFGDFFGNKYGLKGRILILSFFLLFEGLGLLLFSSMTMLTLSVVALIAMALFVKMSNGATYSIVPFVNKNATGAVSGIVGAGGNAGAVMFGFILHAEGVTYREGLFVIGIGVAIIAALALLIKFPAEEIVKEENKSADSIPVKKEAEVALEVD